MNSGVHAQGLEIIIFSTDRLVLAVACNHSLPKKSIAFAETLEYAHIGLHEGSTLQHFLNRIVSESGQRLNLRIQVHGFEAMCRMIKSDIGIGILPQSVAQRHKLAMQIELIEMEDPWALRERSIVVQRMESLPQYARALVDCICALPAN